MHPDLLSLLRCPASGALLHIEGEELVSADGRFRYPLSSAIPRFVPTSNYADGFGLQWNRFRRTQLDSSTGRTISADRLWAATGWSPDELEGRWVLDAGCGSGRFAEVALAAGANVVALDYSSAVDACAANLGPHPRLHPIQGDLRALPFAAGTFDLVYSLGVLQHTPDPAASLASLAAALRPGGRLCVDVYLQAWWDRFTPRRLLRPITRRLPAPTLLRLVERSVPTLLRVASALRRIPVLGRVLSKAVPVADYRGKLDLSEQQHIEWSTLDTFDWLSPRHDKPQSPATLRSWLGRAGLVEVEILRVGPVVGRGRRPASRVEDASS